MAEDTTEASVHQASNSDAGATFETRSLAGASDDAGQLKDSSNPWMASHAAPYWQDEWGGNMDYGMSGQGGDWHNQNVWQMNHQALDMDGWQQKGDAPIFAGRPKRRFCTSYPDVNMCRKGAACAFAHSREEICAPLLSESEEQQDPTALTNEFFMFKYKTRWCPIGVQHEWHSCVYAHNYQDARRPVDIGYGARLCPYWSKKDTGAEYSQRCPLGLRCPYSHGAKEQLYHPHYFKTVVCRDLKGKACPRQTLCAFFHYKAERRPTAQDDVEYNQPLPLEALPEDWVQEFLSPPFLPEGSKQKFDTGKAEGTMMPYVSQVSNNSPYGQMPCVFFLPVSAMMPGMPGAEHAIADQSCSPTGSPQSWVFVPMDGSNPIPMPMC